MPNATIQSLTQTQTANFSTTVMFPNGAVTGLEKTDINLRARTENGITGVDFSIVGTQPTANFTLMFTLPNAQGSFSIEITGMVTPQGGSTPEAVMSNSVVVHYDTTGNVTVTFGTVEYRDGGEIAVPVTFGEAVVANAKTVFPITHVSGDDLAGIEYYLLGENTAWELVFQIPPDRKGRFRISANGDVLKSSSAIFDNVLATPIEVDYSTVVPELVDYDIPSEYTPGETFDVILQFNTDVTLSPAPAGGSFLDHFIFEGADLGGANIYRKTNNTYPTLPIPDFPDVNGNTDWVQTDLTTETATLYLLRWAPVQGNPEGVFNMTVRPGAVRGPVS